MDLDDSDGSDQAVTLAAFQSKTRPAPVPEKLRTEAPTSTSIEIRVPEVQSLASYGVNPAESTVRRVLAERAGREHGKLTYNVKFEDGHTEQLSFDDLIVAQNGKEQLARFEQSGPSSDTEESADTEDSDEPDDVPKHSKRASTRHNQSDGSSDELGKPNDIVSFGSSTRSSSTTNNRTRRSLRNTGRQQVRFESEDPSESEEDTGRRRPGRRGRVIKSASSRNLRSAGKAEETYELVEESTGDEDEEQLPYLMSDVLPRKPKKKMTMRQQPRSQSGARGVKSSRSDGAQGTRQSGRSTRHQRNMGEVGMEQVYRSTSDSSTQAAPKAVGVKEAFKQLEPRDAFHLRHCQQCDTCGKYSQSTQSHLIHCQGCTLSYHKACIGNRSTRDHLVTKIGDDDFVLQCRRCISHAKRKHPTAPDQGLCQVCREVGTSCVPFRSRKTPAQEEREREDNLGRDPIVNIKKDLINNAANVLFRCTKCWRGFHMHHLPPRTDVLDLGRDDESIAEERFTQYRRDWMCRDCVNATGKVSGLVAWRPTDVDAYTPGLTTAEVNEDEQEYLVKWDQRSYFQAQWMPGAWVWGVTAGATRMAFAKRHDGNNLPTMNTEDAIPEDYLRIDIVLEVKYTSYVETRAEEVDKARIREVDKAQIKYKGLGYEDVVWETVPGPEDGDRWTDFVKAYDDWVMRRYVRIPKSTPLKARLEKARDADFQTLEKEKQPEYVVGGELMKYQLEGTNWLFYRWHQRKNAILADEMGLGKTIQLITLFALLVKDFSCFPFLVVVPNSTVANWRREIKNWVPSLRVVTYFGSAVSRNMAYQHELYPEGSKELRCHVVVTSYDAAADSDCNKFFKSVPWQGLIVDEGQRLKNDEGQLYAVLRALKIPFRVLLTGTPLQNNPRELFNLLQFIDDSFNAKDMDLEFAELTKKNIPQLHNLIRPFFLRRTKAQVLTFLPPMAQVILPVSMSLVQSKLYSSILARNASLLRAIFDSNSTVKITEKTNLNNILMQLRKCLCHPFVYSRDIEERSVAPALLHKNLVEASGKLQLLELLLPKLKERGHRVLIFSQFLDELSIIEDFLDGLMLRYQRLDGSVSSLQKQKRIDEFNDPNSPLFAFLLSTRAGGVGINLASADTVIIMDPDFNPHQDIQALSRAHRIGQKKKVLCFQLMTQASVEEKIVQIGRKKMALDHVLIERMDADEDAGIDVESILRHGAAEILGGEVREIRYDEASVDKLLDRSQIEETKAAEDNSAESQFSFARVWANDAASMMDSLDSSDEDRAPDPSTWAKILKERERIAAEEAAGRQQALGRGKRARQTVDYSTRDQRQDSPNKVRRLNGFGSDSDTDFMAHESEDHDSGEDETIDKAADRLPEEVRNMTQTPMSFSDARTIASQQARTQAASQATPSTAPTNGFTAVNTSLGNISAFNAPAANAPAPSAQAAYRVALNNAQASQHPMAPSSTAPRINPPSNKPTFQVPGSWQPPSQRFHANQPRPPKPPPPQSSPPRKGFRRSVTIWPDGANDSASPHPQHFACGTSHEPGHCPIKLAGPEFCNLCGLAHFGVARTCPHIQSETQVREMLRALKSSPESRVLVQEATKYLAGVKGTLVQAKKIRAAKAAEAQGLRAGADGVFRDGAPPSGMNVDGQVDQIGGLAPKPVQKSPQPSVVDRSNEHLRHQFAAGRPSWMNPPPMGGGTQ